ncbi:MAG: hypothetical protein LLG20_15995 [Acidobacteriales bacterium]|nr:hypothetical protein [Terriglobales bacterium]
MQIVIAMPQVADIGRLTTQVCGVPLLVRVLMTTLSAGVGKVLLVLPDAWPRRWLQNYPWSRDIEASCIETVEIGHPFDPDRREDWRAIEHCLDDRFLWMPYDYLAHGAALSGLISAANKHPGSAVRFSGVAATGPDKHIYDRPGVFLKSDQIAGSAPDFWVIPVKGQPGVSLRPSAQVVEIEAELVRRSGKATDGIYSRFNQRLSWPVVRWLSRTCVTPNAVTFVSMAVSAMAGLNFARGSWAGDVTAAAVFFLSGLIDEIDGMLTRLKFQESPFSCWLKTWVDYSSYLLIFVGMTAGGYRRGGVLYLFLGAGLLCGSLLSFAVISVQRGLAAPRGKPNEYSRRYLAALDRDSANPISRLVRQLQFLTKKGVLIYYLLLGAVLNAMPAVMFLSAFGANVVWMVTIYFNRKLFLAHRRPRRETASLDAVPMEVER